MSAEAIVEKYMAAATKRFLGSCDSLIATPGDEGIIFEFSVSGALSRLEVHTGNLTPTKVRSAFVELGMEIGRLSRIRDGREPPPGRGRKGQANTEKTTVLGMV